MKDGDIMQKPYQIHLDLYGTETIPTKIMYYTGDQDVYPLEIHISKNGKPYQIPPNTQVYLTFVLPNKTADKALAEVVDEDLGILSYEFFGSEFSLPGDVVATVELHTTGKRLTWQPFKFRVYESLDGAGAEPPEPMDNWAREIEDEISGLKDSLGARGIPSGGAPGQVLTKMSPSEYHVAWRTPSGGGGDGGRGYSPFVGLNGNWFQFNDISQDYEDTGVSAEGPPGGTGPQGEPGIPGRDGIPGEGVPIGGESGFVLAKKSSGDYDTIWVQPTIGSGDYNQLVNTPIINIVGTTETPIHIDSITAPGRYQLSGNIQIFDDGQTYLPGLSEMWVTQETSNLKVVLFLPHKTPKTYEGVYSDGKWNPTPLLSQEYVRISGDIPQIITGEKTFETAPKSQSLPESGDDLINRDFADSNYRRASTPIISLPDTPGLVTLQPNSVYRLKSTQEISLNIAYNPDMSGFVSRIILYFQGASNNPILWNTEIFRFVNSALPEIEAHTPYKILIDRDPITSRWIVEVISHGAAT